ncbi:glutamine-hydrolyzing carbamoyl-phosphate synthase small subunit, partial [Candidatus Uhrbacteria bacterium]|nr:glutamine-hydrolyzing carbamoyl-phosphate synthase small subunit [Candidatus Uhrbacteria bacterium]
MARLLLQDGTIFAGEAFGAPVDSSGEVVFTTNMVGYPESMTDPSFRGQILAFTYPLIGNYGVPGEEKNSWGFSENFESEHIHVRGIVVAQVSNGFSHHRAVSSLQRWMEHHGIPGISGIDTRRLTQKLREEGVMLGRIVQEDRECHGESVESMTRGVSTLRRAQDDTPFDDPNVRHLVSEVSIKEPVVYYADGKVQTWHQLQAEPVLSTAEGSYKLQADAPVVLAYDCGMKNGIFRSFLTRGVTVVRVPWDFDLDLYKGKLDGVFVGNGPGDPRVGMEKTLAQIRKAIDRSLPLFGICLGNQLLALAVGGNVYKLKYGHRGANQPAIEWTMDPTSPRLRGAGNGKLVVSDAEPWKMTERCIITSQNHGYAVDAESLPEGWKVWFTNAND